MAARDLALRARELAAAAPAASIERRAFGCASVALGTTGTMAAARKALGSVWPAEVQSAALAALRQLEREAARPGTELAAVDGGQDHDDDLEER
jgi:hypothetical protein